MNLPDTKDAAATSPAQQAGNAAVAFVLITVLIDAMGLGVIIPVMPSLIGELTDGKISTAAQVGSYLTFAYALTQFVAAPIFGSLSDKFGRRPILLGSLLGLGIDYVFLAFAPTLGWLFVGRIIAGITGASFSTAQAYLADITPPEQRSQRFGMIGAAFGVGFVLGPLIGAFASDFGTRVPFMVAACLSLANFIYGYFAVPESLPVSLRRPFSWQRANPIGALRSLGKYKAVLPLLVCISLFYIAGHANQSASSFVAIERYGWAPRQIGYFLTYVGIMIALAQGVLIGRIIGWLGQMRTAWFGYFFYGLGSLLIVFATQAWMYYAFFAVQALGFVSGAALQGMISNQVPASEQGQLQGATGSLISLTGIIGPLLMLQAFTFFTKAGTPLYLPGVPYLIAALLTVVSGVVFWRVGKGARAASES